MIAHMRVVPPDYRRCPAVGLANGAAVPARDLGACPGSQLNTNANFAALGVVVGPAGSKLRLTSNQRLNYPASASSLTRQAFSLALQIGTSGEAAKNYESCNSGRGAQAFAAAQAFA